MDAVERFSAYQAIETFRKRPLIVYATSTRANIDAQIGGDVVREFIDQIDCIDAKEETIDILIHSAGGDALSAWKLISLLRGRFKHVAVLVPFMAFSAATMFALGADEIVMHPHASLGPIDPQITTSGRQFAYEDVNSFLEFLAHDVNLTEASIAQVIPQLFAEADPLVIGFSRRASHLSTDIGERLLRMHMNGREDEKKARSLAENLNKSFFDHSDAITRKRALELGLKVVGEDKELEKLMWNAYCGIEAHMKLRSPYLPHLDILADPVARESIQPVAPISIPSNLSGPERKLFLETVATLKGPEERPVQVPFSYLMAICESTRLASGAFDEGKMWATAQYPKGLTIEMLREKFGWRHVPFPSEVRH